MTDNEAPRAWLQPCQYFTALYGEERVCGAPGAEPYAISGGVRFYCRGHSVAMSDSLGPRMVPDIDAATRERWRELIDDWDRADLDDRGPGECLRIELSALLEASKWTPVR